jgi:hypothetical protein
MLREVIDQNSMWKFIERSILTVKQLTRTIFPNADYLKIILQAVTSERPKLRYAVGNDASSIIQTKTTMSYTEFRSLIKQQFIS